MCMTALNNLASAPLNKVGSLWGDDDLGTKTSLVSGVAKRFDQDMAGGPVKPVARTTAPNQVAEVSAQQRRSRSLISS